MPTDTLNIAGPIAATPPTREVVVAGPLIGYTPSGGFLLSKAIDDATMAYGPRVYDLMALDPMVVACLTYLKAGILADGLQVSPAVALKPDGSNSDDPEYKVAAGYAKFVERCLARLPTPIYTTLWEALDCMPHGATVAEKTYEVCDCPAGPAAGPDKAKVTSKAKAGGPPDPEDPDDSGLLVWKSIKVRPRWAWDFIVDAHLNLLGFRVQTVLGPADVGRDKFAVFTWDSRAGDPRGFSILRPVYNAWNFKVQLDPQYFGYLKRFAEPFVTYTMPESFSAVMAAIDPATGRPMDAWQQAAAQCERIQSAGYAVLPPGALLNLVSSTDSGATFNAAKDVYDREIARGILLSEQTITEAQHSSKANNETAGDITELRVRQGRAMLCRVIEREIFHHLIALNYGEAEADRYCPKAGFTGTNRARPEVLAAHADAFQKGYIDETMLPEVRESDGLPPSKIPVQQLLDEREKKLNPPELPALPGGPENPPGKDPAGRAPVGGSPAKGAADPSKKRPSGPPPGNKASVVPNK